MAINDFLSEVETIYERKCLCVFVLDVSDSMRGKPMEELNKGLRYLYSEFTNNEYIFPKLEVALITFNNIVKIQEPSLIECFRMPHLSATDNRATTMEYAVYLAINLVEHRKEWYKMTGQVYCRPLIVLVSSVDHKSIHNIDSLAQRIKGDTANKKFSFIPIGVDISSVEILNKIRGNFPPTILQNTGLDYIVHHVEHLLDLEDIPLITEEQKPVDISDQDWMRNFPI